MCPILCQGTRERKTRNHRYHRYAARCHSPGSWTDRETSRVNRRTLIETHLTRKETIMSFPVSTPLQHTHRRYIMADRTLLRLSATLLFIGLLLYFVANSCTPIGNCPITTKPRLPSMPTARIGPPSISASSSGRRSSLRDCSSCSSRSTSRREHRAGWGSSGPLRQGWRWRCTASCMPWTGLPSSRRWMRGSAHQRRSRRHALPVRKPSGGWSGGPKAIRTSC